MHTGVLSLRGMTCVCELNVFERQDGAHGAAGAWLSGGWLGEIIVNILIALFDTLYIENCIKDKTHQLVGLVWASECQFSSLKIPFLFL